jgi:maltose alpha-D-glucosyltransferase/alpha-amylase
MITARIGRNIADLMGGYLGSATTLGRRTAEMHLALANDTSNRLFAPEPFTTSDLQAIGVDMTAQAHKAAESLQAAIAASALPEDVAHQARDLLQSTASLTDLARRAATLEFTASKVRVHGDYHLGQVLWSEGDFYILDFEGEPARSIAERREKHSPMKDVAGMLRSFSYAAYASLFAHTDSRRVEFERLEPWARLWQAWASAAFLRGYFGLAGNAQFVPRVPAQRDTLLRLFVIDKALYELNYELNNRPDWVRIPLRGVLGLLNAE